MSDHRLLDTTELVAGLPEALRDRVTSSATTRRFGRGDLVFAQGEAADQLFVVVTGRVAISTRSTDGRESVVAVLEDGALFGELGLFDGGGRSADVRALTDTVLLAVDYSVVRSAFVDHPQALWPIMRILARRLRATDEALADAVFLDVPARTAKRLLEIAGSEDAFTMPMTQEELAGLVGASRERVNKALALFTRVGWLEVKGRSRYRILDRAAMEERANP